MMHKGVRQPAGRGSTAQVAGHNGAPHKRKPRSRSARRASPPHLDEGMEATTLARVTSDASTPKSIRVERRPEGSTRNPWRLGGLAVNPPSQFGERETLTVPARIQHQGGNLTLS